MKNLILILIFFFTSTHLVISSDEVLYCYEIDVNGFYHDKSKNKYERTGFDQDKFTAVVNFIDNTLELDDNDYTCIANYMDDYLTCVDAYAYMFSINKSTLNFTQARGFGWMDGLHDTIYISYGECQKY